eukprot:EST45437.1 Cysteine-rich membrane protein 2 [Spironucleus salmonicida]
MITNCLIEHPETPVCLKCMPGFLPDLYHTSCGSCSSVENCAICKPIQGKLCARCIPGFVTNEDSNTCIAYSGINCRIANVPDICMQCAAGYFLSHNNCDCPRGCLACTISGNTKICQECHSTYLPTPDHACSRDCANIPYCAQCDIFTRHCSACKQGFALVNGMCLLCGSLSVSISGDSCVSSACQTIPHCTLCEDNRCIACTSGIPTQNGLTCGSCDTRDCLFCDDVDPTICGNCESGQAGTRGICGAPLVQNCILGADTICSQCGTGSQLLGGVCVCISRQNCASCDEHSNCQKCLFGFEMTLIGCQPLQCHASNCNLCYADGRCRICGPKFTNRGGGCHAEQHTITNTEFVFLALTAVWVAYIVFLSMKHHRAQRQQRAERIQNHTFQLSNKLANTSFGWG